MRLRIGLLLASLALVLTSLTATLPTEAKATPPHLGPRAALIYYFDKINQRHYRDAFQVWERTGGRNAAGQNEEQFKAGFAQTRHIAVQVGPEGEGEGAAGSVYMELDVKLTASLRSGRKQIFVGTYTMRKSNVDGGHPDWQIYRAEMKKMS